MHRALVVQIRHTGSHVGQHPQRHVIRQLPLFQTVGQRAFKEIPHCQIRARPERRARVAAHQMRVLELQREAHLVAEALGGGAVGQGGSVRQLDGQQLLGFVGGVA